jgi:hypothetical protein
MATIQRSHCLSLNFDAALDWMVAWPDYKGYLWLWNDSVRFHIRGGCYMWAHLGSATEEVAELVATTAMARR